VLPLKYFEILYCFYDGYQVVQDLDLSLDKHIISNVCAAGFFRLRQLCRVRRSLDSVSAATLVHAFVSSRVDYCNAFFGGAEDYYRQIATSVGRCGMCCQWHPEVWSRPVTSLAGRSWTNHVQARWAYVSMPAQQSSSVPDGPLHIRRCLSSTATFCQ